jgi:hypothetical protein
MQTESFCLDIDLPLLPVSLIRESIQTIKTQSTKMLHAENHQGEYIVDLSGTKVAYASYARCELSCNVKNWIRNYIVPPIKNDINASLQFFHCLENNAAYSAHVDRRGRIAAFTLEPGGSSTTTTWYKEHNQPVYRTRALDDSSSGLFIKNLSGLERMFSISVPKHKWILLETRIIHSVTEITDYRMALVINIPTQDVHTFCEYHNLDPAKSPIWYDH